MVENLIELDNHLFIKPEFLNHPFISGNKLRKLKYNLKQVEKEGKTTLLTFGGAYSNHIAAVSFAGKQEGLKTIGLIRGEELSDSIPTNPTLTFATNNGMELRFVSRSDYRRKTTQDFIIELQKTYGDFYLLPEGGTNQLAVKGCEEILDDYDSKFDYICCPVGTGGTIAGLINSSLPHQKIIGFPALKGDFLQREITKFAKGNNWDLNLDYHFGGYAKVTVELISFMNTFKKDYGVQLDPIYTAKMMYGINDLRKKGFFKENDKILAIHTGGLQGIVGMNQKLKQQNKPLIV
ncbi:MAG: 1-aminocyclopropane-1-carboxylate deaminase/D-cysteine desulfhydrase [Psychroserpens sp.]|nr:1-aminocyclopropane-1-carboxylate deaminase/D-cysteine desulfhydrase [Psychroserpens sp.]